MDNLYTIIYQGGHHTAHHPNGREGTDDEQDNQGAGHTCNVVRDRFFEILPGNAVSPHADKYTEGRSHQQRNLTGTGEGVAPKSADGKEQQDYQGCYGYQRNKGGRKFFQFHRKESFVLLVKNVNFRILRKGLNLKTAQISEFLSASENLLCKTTRIF